MQYFVVKFAWKFARAFLSAPSFPPGQAQAPASERSRRTKEVGF